MAVFDPYFEAKASSKPDTKLSYEMKAALVGEPISVFFSSDREAVTTSNVTFRGVLLVTHAEPVGVEPEEIAGFCSLLVSSLIS